MFLGLSSERWLAYVFILLGMSLWYFGFLRPQWFSKKAVLQKPSFKDDSYFWQIFPYGLFFLVGGLVFLSRPGFQGLLVVFICAVWVKILYKLV